MKSLLKLITSLVCGVIFVCSILFLIGCSEGCRVLVINEYNESIYAYTKHSRKKQYIEAQGYGTLLVAPKGWEEFTVIVENKDSKVINKTVVSINYQNKNYQEKIKILPVRVDPGANENFEAKL